MSSKVATSWTSFVFRIVVYSGTSAAQDIDVAD